MAHRLQAIPACRLDFRIRVVPVTIEHQARLKIAKTHVQHGGLRSLVNQSLLATSGVLVSHHFLPFLNEEPNVVDITLVGGWILHME